MFPLTKSVTFNNKDGNMHMLLKYDDKAAITPGLPLEIASYEIGLGQHQNSDKPDYKFKLQINVKNDVHQIPALESV